MKQTLIVLIAAAVCVVCFSCAKPKDDNLPTAAPTLEVTKMPTETQEPTPTIVPTETAVPTEVPTPAPTEAPLSLSYLPEDNATFDKSFAKELLKLNTLGVFPEDFDVVMTDNQNCKIGEHTSAFSVAKGKTEYKGEEKEIIIVLIAGTKGNEWFSNFDFAPSKNNLTIYAENFEMAASDILEKTGDLLGKDKIIVVTGYSRGGAVANLLGYKLNNLGYKKNVFTYTFATPNTVRFESDNCENIFNIVNVNDIVTMVPPEYMGYKRLGTDIPLGEESIVTMGIKAGFLKIKEICPDITTYYEKIYSQVKINQNEGVNPLEFLEGLKDYIDLSPIGILAVTSNHMHETYAALLIQ